MCNDLGISTPLHLGLPLKATIFPNDHPGPDCVSKRIIPAPMIHDNFSIVALSHWTYEQRKERLRFLEIMNTSTTTHSPTNTNKKVSEGYHICLNKPIPKLMY